MMTLREYVEQSKRDYITAVLEQTGQCVTHAARLAHVERTQLHKVIARLGIKVIRGNGANRHGNRGNAAWQALGLEDRLMRMLEKRAMSMTQKCQHD